MVKQQTPTIVSCTLADGQVQPCGLGRVLWPKRWQLTLAPKHNQPDEARARYVTSCPMSVHSQVEWQQLLRARSRWWHTCGCRAWFCSQQTCEVREGEIWGLNSSHGEASRRGAVLEAQDGSSTWFLTHHPDSLQACAADVFTVAFERTNAVEKHTWSLRHGPTRHHWCSEPVWGFCCTLPRPCPLSMWCDTSRHIAHSRHRRAWMF